MQSAEGATASYAVFDAPLEGAILQHTAAVDYYLQTVSSSWSVDPDEDTPHEKLHSAFLADLRSHGHSITQSGTQGEITPCDAEPILQRLRPPAGSHDNVGLAQLLRPATRRPRAMQVARRSRLEQYLEQQVLISQAQLSSHPLDNQAAAASVAELPISSSRNSESGSSSSVEVFKPMEPAAGTAATSLAAMSAALSSTPGEQPQRLQLAPSTTHDAVGAAALQPNQCPAEAARDSPATTDYFTFLSSAVTHEGAACAGAPLVAASTAVTHPRLEHDTDGAAQKQAAWTKPAELQTGAFEPNKTRTGAAATAVSGATKDRQDDRVSAPLAPVNSPPLPVQRPPGFTGLGQASVGLMPEVHGGQSTAQAWEASLAADMQPCSFFWLTKGGLWLSLVLLAVSWVNQHYGAHRPVMQHWVVKSLQAVGGQLYVPTAAALLLHILSITTLARPPLLHFGDNQMEAQYLAWSTAGKVLVDGTFQLLFLMVGGCLWLRWKHAAHDTDDQAAATLMSVVSVVGAGVPIVSMLLLRGKRYMQWREQLLAGCRICSAAALAVVQLLLPGNHTYQLPYAIPFVAVAQLMSIACVQIRLATFVPCQLVHLLVLLIRTRASSPLLHFAQLYGGGLCLPALLLHSMEVCSRRAFVASMLACSAKQKRL